MILLDTLLIGGISFVLRRLADAVDTELKDDTALREALLAAQMRLELGEITEEEFAATERELLDAIREVRERRRPAEADAGELRITGIEASVWSDEGAGEDDEVSDHAR